MACQGNQTLPFIMFVRVYSIIQRDKQFTHSTLIKNALFFNRVPDGLEDVSKYPDLVAELLRRGWTDDDIKNALGKNLLRVFGEVERVRTHKNIYAYANQLNIAKNSILTCKISKCNFHVSIGQRHPEWSPTR